jgi:perosamine synthetase
MKKKNKKFKIPIYEPFLGKEEKEYVNDCLRTNWISSRGTYVDKFEKKFKKFVKSKYVSTCSNGTAAIHLALLSLDIKKGDEVIVPTFTYVATVNAIKYVGAKPVFVDSKINTWQINEKKILEKISKKTKAILLAHLYGQTCDIDAIKIISKEKQIYLIEDCAEAFGTYYKKKHVGAFGDIATYSFFGSKTITTGEGGMVVTDNKKLIQKVNRLKNQGLTKNKNYYHDIVGYNYRMTNICAAIGLAQVEKANEILTLKKKIFNCYKKHLNKNSKYLLKETKDTKSSFWLVSILLPPKVNRELLISNLKNKGIEVKPTFCPMHTLPMYRQKINRFPVSIALGNHGLNLPSSPNLTKAKIIFICKIINNHLK